MSNDYLKCDTTGYSKPVYKGKFNPMQYANLRKEINKQTFLHLGNKAEGASRYIDARLKAIDSELKIAKISELPEMHLAKVAPKKGFLSTLGKFFSRIKL